MSETLLQELLDREAIKELKAAISLFPAGRRTGSGRLPRAVHRDAHFELMDSDAIDGAGAFVALTRGAMSGTRSVHHSHMPELTIDGPADAHGTWVLADYVEWPSGESGVRRGMKGYGRYDETYRRVDGVWKIASWRPSYLRMDPLPREPLPDAILGGPELLRPDPA